MHEKEDAKLEELRTELYRLFSIDLWPSMERGEIDFDGDVLQLYKLYEQKSKDH